MTYEESETKKLPPAIGEVKLELLATCHELSQAYESIEMMKERLKVLEMCVRDLEAGRGLKSPFLPDEVN